MYAITNSKIVSVSTCIGEWRGFFNPRIIFYGHFSFNFLSIFSSQAKKNAKELAKGVRLEYIDR